MISSGTTRPGIWSRSQFNDVWIFLVPVAAAALLWLDPGFDSKHSLTTYLVLNGLIDLGHVLATAVPVYGDPSIRRRLGVKLWMVPLFAFVAIRTLLFSNRDVFAMIIGYWAMYHAGAQLYGWFRIYDKLDGAIGIARRRIEYFTFFSSIVIPLLIWHSGQSSVPPSYIFNENLLLFVETKWIPWLLFVFWSANLIYVLSVLNEYFRHGVFRPGKAFLILNCWACFFGGLVWLQSPTIFWVTLIGTHGLSYHFFAVRDFKRSQIAAWPKRIVNMGWALGALYMVALFVVSGAWMEVSNRADLESANWLLSISWVPIVSHYIFDGIIWRRSFWRA